jgi:hypothetical protein
MTTGTDKEYPLLRTDNLDTNALALIQDSGFG